MREILIDNGKNEEANSVYRQIENTGYNIELQKRNQKIDSLEIIHKTQQNAARNKLLQFENFQKAKENKTQKIIIVSFLLGLFILGLLLFYVFKLTRKQKQSNLMLTKQKADLERMNLLNQKIFTVISHDFKEPMLSLEVLLKSNFSEQPQSDNFAKNKQLIANKLTQANLIMNNLINWAKSELNILPKKNTFSNVYEVAKNTIAQMQPLLENKNIEVKNIIVITQKINLSEDLLMIILRNLLNNAIKYSFEHNDIIIGFNEKTNEYYVQDFGVGMTNTYVENIFKDELSSKIGTRQETGFGLGLQFVNEILKQNNGQIRIESELHEGSIFYFSVN